MNRKVTCTKVAQSQDEQVGQLQLQSNRICQGRRGSSVAHSSRNLRVILVDSTTLHPFYSKRCSAKLIV